MFSKRLLFVSFFSFISVFVLRAQRIIYSEPDKDDNRRMDFVIIGKINGNFLVYKNFKTKSWISILDNDMKPVSKVTQDYMPDDRLINIDFFPYNDFFYAIYEFQRKNVVHCVAVKIDGKGKKMSDIIELDTTHIGITAGNKIYSVITSEDKSKIMVFKINNKNREKYMITTNLYDDSLNLLKKSRMVMPMEEHDQYLDEFYLDNQGDLVFAKYYRPSSDVISRASIVIKYAQADSFFV